MSRPGQAQGFTLLEILISITITAMLVTAGFAAFRGITRVLDRTASDTNRAPSARVLLDRLESELLGTMIVVKQPFKRRLSHPWVFIGEDRVFGTNDSDALRFITSNPARPPGTQSATGVRMITYAVASGKDDDRLALYRAEQRLPRGMQKRIDLRYAEPVIDDLSSLRLRFLAEDGWRDRWDSTDVSQLDQLPTEIEISLQLFETQEDGSQAPGPVYSRTVPIPVRPLSRAPANANDASCPGGVTVRGCMLRLRVPIKKLSEPLQASIQALRRATPDRCWAPETGSPQLAALKDAMHSLLEGDPDEVCQ